VHNTVITVHNRVITVLCTVITRHFNAVIFSQRYVKRNAQDKLALVLNK